MASSAIPYCFLLLFLFYVSSHARENHYFSKVSPYSTTTNNVEKTEQLPPKETNSDNQNVDPALTTPETHNGYGLYGRETEQENDFTYSPEKTSIEGYNGEENSEFMFNNGNPYNEKNKNNFGYNNKQNSLYDNNYKSENRQNSLNANNYNNYRYPVQQQGMSDTRFLENGKYFYDVNNEELYKNRYQYPMRRNDVVGSSGVNSRNQFNQEEGRNDVVGSSGVNSRDQFNQEEGRNDVVGSSRVNSRSQFNQEEGRDENLYRFNNFMENNNNQENKEEYLP